MDLKWQVAMISMRIKKFYNKTGRKLQFDAKEPVGFDKTKVECYNCHKTGHFARECRSKEENRRRDGWNTGNRDGKTELKKDEREELSNASVEIKAYTQGLKKVEAQLVAHQQGQLWYEQKIKFMKIDLDDKTDVLTYHKTLLAKAQKEKDDLEVIVDKWNHSTKTLDRIINDQMSASDKFGLGYGDFRYCGNLSYENETSQSVFNTKDSDFENLPLYKQLYKSCEMQAVPPPMTGNYMPSGPDIEIDDSQYTYGPEKTQPSETESQTTELDTCASNISTEISELVCESVVNKSKIEVQPKVWSDAPIIEEYESDSDDEHVYVKIEDLDTPSFATKHVKTSSENVKNSSTHSQKPKVNNKQLDHEITERACFVCGSFSHLIRDCDYHVKLAKQNELHKQNLSKGNGTREKTNKILRKQTWDNAQRINKQNQFVPLAVQTRTGTNPVNTAKASSTNKVSTARQSINRQTVQTSTALKINTVKPMMNGVRPANVSNKTNSPSSRPFKRTTVLKTNFSNQKVYTTKDNPHRTLKNKGIIDSGCSRHMTGNKAYLADYQDINGGPVAFGGSRGYITGKGKIQTGKLDFEDVSFVKELQHFNLFSVSQMCDKKNKVLFTDTECLILSPDFKLPDENQILLKVPRQNNMYSFNLENIVPLGGLACLIAKATTDESNLWHRRLGHVNFKNLNRLVKGNLDMLARLSFLFCMAWMDCHELELMGDLLSSVEYALKFWCLGSGVVINLMPFVIGGTKAMKCQIRNRRLRHLFDLIKSEMNGFNYQSCSLVVDTISLRWEGSIHKNAQDPIFLYSYPSSPSLDEDDLFWYIMWLQLLKLKRNNGMFKKLKERCEQLSNKSGLSFLTTPFCSGVRGVEV
ncbi:ribonuclease H-like domain-containing protein [Tanacetum coccineum]